MCVAWPTEFHDNWDPYSLKIGLKYAVFMAVYVQTKDDNWNFSSANIPNYIHHSDGNCRKLPVSVKRCDLTYLFNNLHGGNRGKY